ncbi:MAG: hypothetical protein ABS82_00110 [Rhodanobacter sp. SCN 67-45]|nr:MAG: hypothetical protein ABS82_00110 [Rhodanobacter sp. SCN 67-45]
MSILSAAGVAIAGQIEDVLLRQGRSIAGIVPQVVIEEKHRDELVITNHPVQNGANITDHAYKNPAMVSLRYGWSASGAIYSLDLGAPSVDDVYAMLLKLQAGRQPFDVVTGKRSYSNMLIRSLDLVTDQTTENAIIVEVLLQQIIIVQTQTATLKSASVMSMPEKTAPVGNAGVKQPVAVPQSVLYQLSKGAQSILGGL